MHCEENHLLQIFRLLHYLTEEDLIRVYARARKDGNEMVMQLMNDELELRGLDRFEIKTN